MKRQFFRYCFEGVTREVFLIGNIAIKIPKIRYGWKNFLLGLLGNMQEIAFSKTKWPEICPIKFYIPGGWLIVMPRVTLLSNEEWEEFELKGCFSNLDYIIPCENKIDSFGILNNKIVAIDYAS